MNISKLTVGVKHSTSRRTTFPPNPHLVGEATCFLSLHLGIACNELNSHMPLQQGIIFHIPLESTCCLLVAYCHEFLNRESSDGFVIPVEREL